MGGLKEISARRLLEKKPEEVLRLAVKGMLPKNSLGRRQLKKLKIYTGPDHPHQAQEPEKVEI
jgi:large subunit ribosomal protein L13